MKKVRIKQDGRYYDAILDGDIVIPMWQTFKHGDIIVTYGENESLKNFHIVREIMNDYGFMYASTVCKMVVYSVDGKIESFLKAPHVRLANEEEKQKLFKQLSKDGYRWDEDNLKLEKLKE